MKKELIILLMILFSSFLFSQVNFNLEFSFEKINSSDELTNLQLFDYDNDGEDEIVVGFKNDNIWKLVYYNLLGDTLFVYTEETGQDIYFQKAYIFKIENENMLITSSTFTSVENKDEILIKLYSLQDNTLIDSTLHTINIPTCDGFQPPEIKSLKTSLINGNLMIYVGFSLNWHIDYWIGTDYYQKNELSCFSYCDSITHIEDIENSGRSVYIKTDETQLITTGFYEHIDSGDQWYTVSRTYYSNQVNNDLTLNTLNFNTTYGSYNSDIMGTSFYNYPSNYSFVSLQNEITIPDGFILYYKTYDGEEYPLNFVKYSIDFSDTLWVKHDSMTGCGDIGSSTCVSTNIGDNYILYFKSRIT